MVSADILASKQRNNGGLIRVIWTVCRKEYAIYLAPVYAALESFSTAKHKTISLIDDEFLSFNSKNKI